MYTYEKCQSYMLEKKTNELDFSPKRVARVTPVCFCVTKRYWKSQMYTGDGINVFIYVYKSWLLPWVQFLVMFTYLILSSVLGCIAVIQMVTDRHIKHFWKRRLGLWSGWRVYQSFNTKFDNKTLTGNTSFFVNILNFSVFFLTGSPKNLVTWWKMFPWFRFVI